MYDELIAEINETRDDCRDSDFIESAYIGELLGKAADAIEELTDTNVGKWIPVTERLPEEYVNVLVWLRSIGRDSFYYSIDHLMEDGQWWKAANSWKHEVTHWMPLPQPPKEEAT